VFIGERPRETRTKEGGARLNFGTKNDTAGSFRHTLYPYSRGKTKRKGGKINKSFSYRGQKREGESYRKPRRGPPIPPEVKIGQHEKGRAGKEKCWKGALSEPV